MKDVGGVHENEVALFHEVLGDCVMDEALFKKLVFDYGKKHLEVYVDDEMLPKEWSNKVASALTMLKREIGFYDD